VQDARRPAGPIRSDRSAAAVPPGTSRCRASGVLGGRIEDRHLRGLDGLASDAELDAVADASALGFIALDDVADLAADLADQAALMDQRMAARGVPISRAMSRSPVRKLTPPSLMSVMGPRMVLSKGGGRVISSSRASSEAVRRLERFSE